jgi:ABC-type sugar transport system substrate-binding protein
MKSMTTTFASTAAVAAALAMGAVVPAAAQQANQDYSTMPGYSARPQGMCWHPAFGSGHQDNGYWAPCTNTSENQSANSARARAPTPQRTRARHR